MYIPYKKYKNVDIYTVRGSNKFMVGLFRLFDTADQAKEYIDAL